MKRVRGYTFRGVDWGMNRYECNRCGQVIHSVSPMEFEERAKAHERVCVMAKRRTAIKGKVLV